MRETQLDSWTKQLARAALRELRGSLDRFPEDPALLGELTQRVREVISRELPACTGDSQSAVAEELALAVYITMAAQGSGFELTPQLLASMKRSLTRTLEALGPAGGHRIPAASSKTEITDQKQEVHR